MAYTPEGLRQTLPPLKPEQTLWIAFSGGLDSCVLLHSLLDLGLRTQLAAIHVNHQLSPHANAWQQHCADFCAQHKVAFYAERVNIQRDGRGLEDAARAERYRVFAQYVKAGDLLVTAHHSNDQSETLLLRLLRGAGPRGLAAMAPVRSFGEACICRPLLGVVRAELYAYAQRHQLHWVEDLSNEDIHYDRNFLRHEIIPRLTQRWPQLNQRLRQTAQLCAEVDVLLEEMAAEDLQRIGVRSERVGESLALADLKALSLARRHNLLRFWLHQLGVPSPEQVHLREIERQLVHGRQDAEAQVCWGSISLRTYQGRLYLLPIGKRAANMPVPMEILIQGKTTAIPLTAAGGQLHLMYEEQSATTGNLRADVTHLNLRVRNGGERCQPHDRPHSQTLKKLLQEYRLEPWWRDQVPLLSLGEKIVAAGDLWVCKGFEAAPGTPGFRLRWQPGNL